MTPRSFSPLSQPLYTVTPNTLLTTALNMLLETGVSCLPVVDDKRCLIDLYARSDITALCRGNAYNRLQLEDVTVSLELAFPVKIIRFTQTSSSSLRGTPSLFHPIHTLPVPSPLFYLDPHISLLSFLSMLRAGRPSVGPLAMGQWDFTGGPGGDRRCDRGPLSRVPSPATGKAPRWSRDKRHVGRGLS